MKGMTATDGECGCGRCFYFEKSNGPPRLTVGGPNVSGNALSS
jgi:hypothetical protein